MTPSQAAAQCRRAKAERLAQAEVDDLEGRSGTDWVIEQDMRWLSEELEENWRVSPEVCTGAWTTFGATHRASKGMKMNIPDRDKSMIDFCRGYSTAAEVATARTRLEEVQAEQCKGENKGVAEKLKATMVDLEAEKQRLKEALERREGGRNKMHGLFNWKFDSMDTSD